MRRLHIRVDLQGSAPEGVRQGYTPAQSGWMIPVGDDVTIEGLAAAITESYRRRYPDFAKTEPDLNILEVQDGYGCSLDMDYSVGQIFDSREATSDARNYTVHVVRGPLTPAEVSVIHARTASPALASSPAPGSSVRIPKRSMDSDFTFFPRPEHPFKRRKVTSDVFHVLSDSDHASSVERDTPRRIPMHSSQLQRTFTPDRSERSDHSMMGNQDIGDTSNLDFISAPQSPRNESPVAQPNVQDNAGNVAKGLINGGAIKAGEETSPPVKKKVGRPRKSDATAATRTPKKAADGGEAPKKPGRKKKQVEPQGAGPAAQPAEAVAQSIESSQPQAEAPKDAAPVKPEPKKLKQNPEAETTKADENDANPDEQTQATEEVPAKIPKGGKPRKTAQTSTATQEPDPGDDQPPKKPRARKSATAAKTQPANDGSATVEQSITDETTNGLHEADNIDNSTRPPAVSNDVTSIGNGQAHDSGDSEESQSEPDTSSQRPDQVETSEQNQDSPETAAAVRAKNAAIRKKNNAAHDQYLHDLANIEVPPEAAARMKVTAKKPQKQWVPGAMGRPPKNAKEIIAALSRAENSQEPDIKEPQAAVTANGAPEEPTQSTQSTDLHATETFPEAAPPVPVKVSQTKKKPKGADLGAYNEESGLMAQIPPKEDDQAVQKETTASAKKKAASKPKSKGNDITFKTYVPPDNSTASKGKFATLSKAPSPPTLPQVTSKAREADSDDESSTGSETTAASRPSPKPSSSKVNKAASAQSAKPPTVSAPRQSTSAAKAPESKGNVSDTSSMSGLDSDAMTARPSKAKGSNATKQSPPAIAEKVAEKPVPAPAKKATKKSSTAAAKKADAADRTSESAQAAPIKVPTPKDSSSKVSAKSHPKAPPPKKADDSDTSSEESTSDSDEGRPGNKLPPPVNRPPPPRKQASNSAAAASSSQTVGGGQQGNGGKSISNGIASEPVLSFSKIRQQVKQPPFKSPLPTATTPASAPTETDDSSSDDSSSEEEESPQQAKPGTGGAISSLKKLFGSNQNS